MTPRLFHRVSLVLTALNVGVIGLVVVAVLGVVYGVTASRLRSAQERDVALSASDVAQSVGESRIEGERFTTAPNVAGVDYWLFDSLGATLHSPAVTFDGLPIVHDVLTALNGDTAISHIRLDGTAYIVATRPTFHDGIVIGAVQVIDQDDSGRALGVLILALGAAGVGGLVIAGIAGYGLTQFALRPVRAAFESQRAFIADASHELRTPIAVIQADADAVARLAPNLSADDARLLDDLQQEAAFAGTTVARLLDLARLDAGDGDLPVEPTDVGGLARQCVSAMQSLANASQVDLSSEVPERALMAEADEARLRLGLMAVIDNAIKYNKPGGTVEVVVGTEGDRAIIEVRDTGEGIPRDQQDSVFERFFRVDKSHSRATGGAGLGLPLMKQSVEAMGGTASLTSELGAGTTVRISLRKP